MLKVVMLLLAISALGQQPPTAAFSAEARVEAELAAMTARNALDLVLSDYSTARFRDVRALGKPGERGVVFCGLVNAKNHLGAYVGWRRFGVFRSTVGLEGQDEFSEEELEVICGRDDLTADTRDWSASLTYR